MYLLFSTVLPWLAELTPPGVDPSRRELHLDAAAFAGAFGMDLAAFEALPKWKQAQLKRARGLF